MKIAISSVGPDLDSQVDPRFGRCAVFIILETENMQFEAIDNQFKDLSGGAGIQAAGFIADKGVTAILTGRCGPNATGVFQQAGIEIVTGLAGTVREAVQHYRNSGLQNTPAAPAETVPSKPVTGVPQTPPARGMGGQGRGMGMGGGRGCGRGMGGRGGGRGMGRGRW